MKMEESEQPLVRDIIQQYRDDLETLTEAPHVQGYAAQEEIEEALNHLDAAIVDLDRVEEE